jgi:hypothetical protein
MYKATCIYRAPLYIGMDVYIYKDTRIKNIFSMSLRPDANREPFSEKRRQARFTMVFQRALWSTDDPVEVLESRYL